LQDCNFVLKNFFSNRSVIVYYESKRLRQTDRGLDEDTYWIDAMRSYSGEFEISRSGTTIKIISRPLTLFARAHRVLRENHKICNSLLVFLNLKPILSVRSVRDKNFLFAFNSTFKIHNSKLFFFRPLTLSARAHRVLRENHKICNSLLVFLNLKPILSVPSVSSVRDRNFDFVYL
jgi:hypothetical protein